MSKGKQPKLRPDSWRKFWREWGIFLVVAAALAGGVLLVGFLSSPWLRGTQINPTAPYRTYFTQGELGSPKPQGLEAEVLKDIATARESLDVATPRLDLDTLADSLIEAKTRGVQVRVLTNPPDPDDSAASSLMKRLRENGIGVATHPAQGGLAEAFIVVDERLVWAGCWELSRRGLCEDAGFVMRWDILEMGGTFHREFMEMYADAQFGPTSPANTAPRYITVPDISTISVYMTPEDDPLSEVLQSMARVRSSIILLTEGLNDIRLEDRLIGESAKANVSVAGVLGSAQSSEESLADLRRKKAMLFRYAGPGEMRENAIVLDGEVVMIFSHRLDKEVLDRDDGFVIVVRDRQLGDLFRDELTRLVQQGRPSP